MGKSHKTNAIASQTITKPSRIEGTRKALMHKVELELAYAGHRTSENYYDAQLMIWPPSFMDLAPTPELIRAFGRAAKSTPDWKRLPEGALPGAQFIEQRATTSRHSQPRSTGRSSAVRPRDLGGFSAVHAASVKAHA